MEWAIQEIAKLAGTTSRALRHYDEVGLVRPSRIGANGYRYYDADALVRLQRVMLMRQLGLGLAEIAGILDQHTDAREALKQHLGLLADERARIDSQIAAVKYTIARLEKKDTLMPNEMFDGFDHTQYREEVTERWGADAYAASDAWWRGQSAEEQADWMRRLDELNRDWIAASRAEGSRPDSAKARDLARRHVAWLESVPGTPMANPSEREGYLRGIVDLYVSDERFAKNYGGVYGARFVREAILSLLDS